MKNRFEVRRGRFGAYFYDKEYNKDLDLAETVSFLNVLHNEHLDNSDRKISEQGKAVERPPTKVKTPAEKAPTPGGEIAACITDLEDVCREIYGFKGTVGNVIGRLGAIECKSQRPLIEYVEEAQRDTAVDLQTVNQQQKAVNCAG